MQVITERDAAGRLDWAGAVAALEAGHGLPRAEVGDLFLGPADATLLNRAAYIEGLGYGVKAVTVVDGNAARGLPSVQGAMTVFRPTDGRVSAIIDSALVTRWKTAADSVLGARRLARPGARHLLLVGAGAVAASLAEAYPAVLTGIDTISVWARRPEQAESLARQAGAAGAAGATGRRVVPVTDLAAAVAAADIVATATLARQPVLRGAWLRPGTHVDLIGAYKADMREADDTVLRRGRIFVDSRATTLGHIGELTIPLAAGTITEADVLGDHYDMQAGRAGRAADDEITVFKNGGGAHMDLMIARYIAARVA